MRIVSNVNLKLILLYLMHICVALLTAAALNSRDTDVAGITQKTNLEIMQFRAHPRGKHRCVHLCVYAGECERASLLYGILERLRASVFECVWVCVCVCVHPQNLEGAESRSRSRLSVLVFLHLSYPWNIYTNYNETSSTIYSEPAHTSEDCDLWC